LSGMICNRNRFGVYAPLFTPPVTSSHLVTSNVERFLDDGITLWTDNHMQIQMTLGSKYPLMPLLVYEFRAADLEFLKSYKIIESKKAVFVYTLPLGLRYSSMNKVKEKCLEYIRTLVENRTEPQKRSIVQTSSITWKVFQAIDAHCRRSHSSENNSLLKTAIMLYEMHHFMSCSIFLSKPSLEQVQQKLLSPAIISYDEARTSRVVGRQLKHAMNSLIVETTGNVLDHLERELKKKSRAHWADCFCVILILCMCVEAVQIAIDGRVIYNMGCKDDDNTPMSREISLQASLELDGHPYAHCTEVFHYMYKSPKSKEEKGFNPIRDGPKLDKVYGLNESEVHLVEEIIGIMDTSGKELREGAKNPSFNTKLDEMDENGRAAHHASFRKENSGRSVSRYLRSFGRVVER